MRRKHALISMVAVVLAASYLAAGCGGGGRDLSYSTDPEKPVITYSSYKAIAPVYNPGVPVVVIYGDGKLIKKEGSYDLTTGKLTDEQVSGILKTLEGEGYFELKETYASKEPLAGGTTEELDVDLDSGTQAVSVEGGAGPAGWDDMVAAVTDVKVSDVEEYVPPSITLFAQEAAEVPTDAEVRPWPGDAADLERAASAQVPAAAAKLNGEEAGFAWKAVQESFSADGGGSEAYWSAGGKVYTYVYATPIMPGMEEGD